jgi:hypothetical protein
VFPTFAQFRPRVVLAAVITLVSVFASAPALGATAPSGGTGLLVGSFTQRLAIVSLSSGAVTLDTPANGTSTNDTTPTYMGAADDTSGDSVTVKVYNGSDGSGTPLQTFTTTETAGSWSVDGVDALSPGQYTARAEQGDSAGNTGQSNARTFTVDTTAPTVTLTAPNAGSSTND